MTHRARNWSILAFIAALVAVMLHAPDAWAIADDASGGHLRCSGGHATGQLFISGPSCPTTLGFDNLFSFLVCNFEQLASNLLGHLFCGMILDLAPAVWAAVTLAIVIFGISFTIGLVPATGQEAILFAIKLAFITTFATNADYLIGYGYTFLIAGIREGTTIALTTLNSSGINSGSDVYAEMDKILAHFFHFATDSEGAATNADYCKNALFAVIALFMTALPIAAYVALLVIGRMMLTLFRAVFAYVYAVIGIAFLLTLAPFFLGFYLFKHTRNLFDRWVGYLVSFALQVVLMFAFLTFIVIIVKDITNNNVVTNLTSIVRYNQQTTETTALRFSLTYCTLCEFDVVNKETGAILHSGDPDYTAKGKLQCKTPEKPITPNFAMSPDARNQIEALLTFIGEGLIPLVIIVLLIEKLLKLVPALAQRLASGLGASYATQLGGGVGTATSGVTRMPSESYLDNFKGGFESGFRDGSHSDGLTKTVQGVKDGFAAMITGSRADGGAVKTDDPARDAATPQNSIQNSFARWIRDPSSFGR